MDTMPADPVVVFDEAYIELLPDDLKPDTLSYLATRPGTCVLRTFSKVYGLAGLRIGYALASPDMIALLNRVRQPFNVNAMAQAAALAALDDEEHVERTRQLVRDEYAFLCSELDRLGLNYVPSVANFMLVEVGDGRAVFEALQRRRAIVRPMQGYGLPDHVRVTLGTRAENEVLVKALEDTLAERG
jgi:histidinol-phosphate aminotransferase